jgi:Type I phosphodiesterase / nucleotide pyrophosphatase
VANFPSSQVLLSKVFCCHKTVISSRHNGSILAFGMEPAMRRPILFAAAILQMILAQALFGPSALAQAQTAQPHNVVLFIADGLRFRMVDDSTAPTMAAMARQGVSLRNSHALFPTFTTANASGMATGHMLGDTGDFSNTIYTGFEVPGAGASLTPFLESDVVLGDVDEHFAGNYLDEATILKLARDKGYSTASIGKIGPALIFDPTERSGEQTILIDDATGTAKAFRYRPTSPNGSKAQACRLLRHRAAPTAFLAMLASPAP